MNIYLAASFKSKEKMREYRNRLELAGHKVTSRWIDSDQPTGWSHDEIIADFKTARKEAYKDRYDIDHADLVLVFTDPPSTTGGFHWELGYAAGKDKPVWVIGRLPNIFFALPNVRMILSDESWIDKLGDAE